MSAFALTIQNLSWQVANKQILSDISFSVEKGMSIGIVGPNGAGKTSLLRCLYQEYTDYQGKVAIHGSDAATIDSRAFAKRVAVVTQQQESIFALTVRDVVHMGLVPHKSLFERDTSEDLQLIEHALKRVDLLDKSTQLFTTLSGGEQQRCLIARAIVQRPQILVLDEPSNHLDVAYQHQLLQLVEAINVTTIMSIHDLNLAAQYCDRIMLLKEGEVVAFDTPDKVFTPQLLMKVFDLPCVVDLQPFSDKLRVTFAPSKGFTVKASS